MATGEHVINITLLLSSIQTNVAREISETASKIALQNFNGRFMAMVYLNSSLCLAADLFLKSYRKAVVLGRGTFYPKILGKTSQYVLFGSDLANIVYALEWMRNHEFDSTGKYIIICQDTNECDEALAMRKFWEYKVTNVIFLKYVINEVAGFTYFPLYNSSCVYDEPVRLTNLTSCLNSGDSCNLFPMKLGNFNACPLIVSTFVHQPFMKIEDGKPSGTDGDLLCLIAEKLNGKLHVMTPKIGTGWGKLEPNGTWSGSLADLYYDYANFSMTSGALTLTRFTTFQLSDGYGSENVIWVTPSAKKIPSSLKLSYPFQANARIALAVSFAFVIVCALIFQSRFYSMLSRKLKMERSRSRIVFYSWMVCMGLAIPTTRLPKKTALLYIVLLWIWYCILVRTFYQVTLISAMKSNYYYQELESIDEAIQAEYAFGGGVGLKDYFIDYPVIYNNWQNIETLDIIPTMKKISQGMEFVLAMSMLTAKTIIREEKIKVHIMRQKVVTSPSVIFFKKFSPLVAAVNKALNRLHESGFSEKFYKDYAPTVVQKAEDSIESIKLAHYTGCYVVLITGWIVSFLLFVLEIIFDKVVRRHMIAK